MNTRTYNYTTYFLRLLRAAGRLNGFRAAVLGMHWERWASKQQFGERWA